MTAGIGSITPRCRRWLGSGVGTSVGTPERITVSIKTTTLPSHCKAWSYVGMHGAPARYVAAAVRRGTFGPAIFPR